MIADEGFDPDLDGEGLCKVDHLTIYINRDQAPEGAYARIRAHEEFHMVGDMIAAGPVKRWLKAMGLSLTEDQYVEFEELLVETYGAGWFTYLSDNGYLRYPQL